MRIILPQINNITSQIEEINRQANYRSREITLMFTQLNSFTPENNNIVEKYFLARNVVVFSYGTIEKFTKILTNYALTSIIDNNYFNNNSKDLLCIIKAQNNVQNLFNILMYYKLNSGTEHNFNYAKDKSYFSNLGKVDSTIIAHVCDALSLNKKEPYLKIPKLTLDSLYKNRTMLAHGDYMDELKDFLSIQTSPATIEDIDEYVYHKLKLNDTTKNELLTFIFDFKEKIISLLNEIEEFIQISTGA